MVYCGLCKETREPRYNWFIQEHAANSSINKFKICDSCASHLLKGMTKKVLGIRDGHPLPDPLVLSKTGVINEIILNEESSLDITIAIDISKARRWVEKELETD